jgi:hypothetical protein
MGDAGERLAIEIIDGHSHWLERLQSHDFGIDLEAELGTSDASGQVLAGKLLKIQVKARGKMPIKAGGLMIRLSCDYLEYIGQFRLPVILVVVELESRRAWYLWLQRWILDNEEKFVASSHTMTVALWVPETASLGSGLDGQLKRIARGEDEASMVLALRELLLAALAIGKETVLESLFSLLQTLSPSPWAIEKTINALVGFKPNPWFYETSQMLPHLHSMIKAVGNLLTSDQVFRVVARGPSFSRTGVNALALLFNYHPQHALALKLAERFRQADLDDVAWYCDLRARYPKMDSIAFWGALGSDKLGELKFGDLELIRTEQAQEYIRGKWPNRGHSVFLDCLSVIRS